jgi:predicted nucleic acid-binding protein
MKALLDLNVLLDFLNKRQFHAEAARILGLAGEGRIDAFVSAHEITTLAYFLDKEGTPGDDFRQVLSLLFELVDVLPVDGEALEKALYSKMGDYEDAVLETVSLHAGLDYIVTRNVKDFKKSRVEAVNPSVFLELIGAGG